MKHPHYNKWHWILYCKASLYIHTSLFLRYELTIFRPGGKPLSEPMIVSLPTHICVTRPQWVKGKGNLAFIYRLLNIYSSGIWLWYMQALFINRVKQNRCLKSENPQPMVATILPPCSGKQMWMWCSVVSSPAWWVITPSPIPEAARCQLLLRAGQLRYLNVSARKLPPKLQCQEMINIT